MSDGPPRALFVGRFQPFHRGHLETIRAIRRGRPAEVVLIGIGSAQESYTRENPFTAGERFEMIELSLQEAHLSDVIPVPIPDIHRHALWVRYVEGLLPPFTRVYTNNPLTRILFEAGGYTVESPTLFERERWEGLQIRAALERGSPVDSLVPPAVAQWLDRHQASARLRSIGENWATPSRRP